MPVDYANTHRRFAFRGHLIGGFDLGFERAGFEIKWQVEIEPYAQRVLEKLAPNAKRYDDVCAAGGFVPYRHVLEPVDVICGGFPCQDISYAGFGAGMDGARSGLWGQMHRIVRELRPRYVVVENVAALLERGIGRVLGDLAGLGFDAEWSSVSACALGLTHVRQRLFIVAHANREHGRPRVRDSFTRAFRPLQTVDGYARARTRAKARLANPSELYGGADGIPNGSQRNRGIGNAVAPDVAEFIARRILKAEGR